MKVSYQPVDFSRNSAPRFGTDITEVKTLEHLVEGLEKGKKYFQINCTLWLTRHVPLRGLICPNSIMDYSRINNCDCSGVDLSNLQMRGGSNPYNGFIDSDFTKANFSRAKIDKAKLVNCCFNGADFTGAILGSPTNETEISGSDFTNAHGLNLSNTWFYENKTPKGINIKDYEVVRHEPALTTGYKPIIIIKSPLMLH